MNWNRKNTLFGIGFFLVFSLLSVAGASASDEESLSIAVVGPMSGASKYKGREMVCGVNLCLNNVNSEGGINGKKVELLVFDDLGDPRTAAKCAMEIAENDKILFVVGHRSSSASIAGGKIYREKRIPALTATATAEGVTRGNDWYFRVVFNNRQQGKIIANYVNQVLGYNTASIIHDENAYGTSLAKAFENASQTLGLTVNYKWSFDKKKKGLEKNLREIIRELSETRNTGVIFLAVNEDEAVTLIKEMKVKNLNYPIIGGDSLGKSSFPDKFRDLPMERLNPGFHSDDIYAATFLILDAAGLAASRIKTEYKEEFGEEPNAAALAYYDAASMGIEALKHAGISGKNISDDREKVRNCLASINSIRNAFRGITGHIYFDDQGDALKTVPVGVYKNMRLISAPVQLTPVTHFTEIEDIRKRETDQENTQTGDILRINNMYFRKTNFVYTGIEPIEIDQINTADMSFNLDFYLWFRFQEGIEPDKIEFLNSIEQVKLEPPVDEKRSGKIIYRKYRIKHAFKADFLPDPPTYGQHILGVSFLHQNMVETQLVYIVDILGMGMGDGKTEDRLDGRNFLSPIHGWTVLRSHFFRDVLEKKSMGDPGYLGMEEGKIDYSRFNLGIFIKKTRFTVRGIIKNGPLNYALLTVSVLMFLTSLAAMFVKRYRTYAKSILFAIIFSVTLFMVTFEIALLDALVGRANLQYLKLAKTAFDILWWVVPAFFITKLIKHFVWIPLEKQTERTVPSLLVYFIEFVVYILAFFGVVAFVFDQKLTSLLATSGVIAMIIGMAIQINISNIFSGIAINMERPFRIGDWVKIGDYDEGRVVDITWRSTRIVTRNGALMGIPNSNASETIFHNYSHPNDVFEEWVFIFVDPVHPNERVEKILLDAALSTDARILKSPSPFTRLSTMEEWASKYLVGYCITNFAGRNTIKNHVWTRILRHLEYAGITPAIKDRQKHNFRSVDEFKAKDDCPFDILDEIDLFKLLPRESKISISEKMKKYRFEKDETIVDMENETDSLFMIVEGVAGIFAKSENGKTGAELSRMGVGNVLDKTAILECEPGAAKVVSITVACVFEIEKSSYQHLMDKKT